MLRNKKIVSKYTKYIICLDKLKNVKPTPNYGTIKPKVEGGFNPPSDIALKRYLCSSGWKTLPCCIYAHTTHVALLPTDA